MTNPTHPVSSPLLPSDAGSPHVSLSADTCHQRHCDWDSSVAQGKPWCVLSTTRGVRYSVASQTHQGNNLRVNLQRHGSANYGGDFSRPSFRADFLSDTLVRFTVSVKTLSFLSLSLFFLYFFYTNIRPIIIISSS